MVATIAEEGFGAVAPAGVFYGSRPSWRSLSRICRITGHDQNGAASFTFEDCLIALVEVARTDVAQVGADHPIGVSELGCCDFRVHEYRSIGGSVSRIPCGTAPPTPAEDVHGDRDIGPRLSGRHPPATGLTTPPST